MQQWTVLNARIAEKKSCPSQALSAVQYIVEHVCVCIADSAMITFMLLVILVVQRTHARIQTRQRRSLSVVVQRPDAIMNIDRVPLQRC